MIYLKKEYAHIAPDFAELPQSINQGVKPSFGGIELVRRHF